MPSRSRVSEAEYLAYDLAADGRHEFVNGEILAMAGASEAHSQITGNLLTLLRSGGRPCRVYANDMRVRVDETGLYAYPDLVGVCGERAFADTHPETLLNPELLVEVLSESTEDYDRGAKLEHYRRRPSVRCVLLVDSRERRVTRYTRNGDRSWTLVDITEGSFDVAPFSTSIAVDAIYAGAEESRGWGRA